MGIENNPLIFCEKKNLFKKVLQTFRRYVLCLVGAEYCDLKVLNEYGFWEKATIILRLAEPGEKRCYRNRNTSFSAEIC